MKTDFEKIKVDIMNQEIEINGKSFKHCEVDNLEELECNDLRILRVVFRIRTIEEQLKSTFRAQTIKGEGPQIIEYYIIQNKEKYECFLKDIAESKSVQAIFVSNKNQNRRMQMVMRNIFFDACCKYELDPEKFFPYEGDGYTRPGLAYPSMFDFRGQRPIPFKNKIFCDNDFDEIKILFKNLMLKNIKNLKNKKIMQAAINLVNIYKKDYGEDLAEINGIQDKYLEQKDWRNICESIDSEIDLLNYGIDHNVRNESDFRTILKALEFVKESVRKQFYEELKNSLRNEFGGLTEKKVALLKQLKGINFDEAVQLYKVYILSRDALNRKDKECLFSDVESPYKAYIEFYDYGCVLISDYLNTINKNKSKEKYIPQEKVDSALMYFYETKSVDAAKAVKKENEYNDNRANGEKGEKEVDYALKWLDKNYVSIPRLSEDGYGNRCIIISNPEFIDEPQEYDHIVVGRQGIFLIETKNYAGKLIVDKYGNWIRIKQDGTEEGERNPIQQVRRHEKMLRSIIPENIEIIDVICMAHPKMIIEGAENCAIPLVKSDLLVEYIENYDNGKKLSDGEIRECAGCIKRYMK